MFGNNDALEKILETLSHSVRLIGETLSKTVDTVRTLDDRSRKSESNINLIADFTSKNAPTITSLPWEVSNLNLGYEKLLVLIEKQDSKIARLEELIARSITVNLKANEDVKNNLNTLINVVEKLHDFTSRQSQVHAEFFKGVSEDYPKTKTVVEYLLLSGTSEPSKKPTSKN